MVFRLFVGCVCGTVSVATVVAALTKPLRSKDSFWSDILTASSLLKSKTPVSSSWTLSLSFVVLISCISIFALLKNNIVAHALPEPVSVRVADDVYIQLLSPLATAASSKNDPANQHTTNVIKTSESENLQVISVEDMVPDSPSKPAPAIPPSSDTKSPPVWLLLYSPDTSMLVTVRHLIPRSPNSDDAVRDLVFQSDLLSLLSWVRCSVMSQRVKS